MAHGAGCGRGGEGGDTTSPLPIRVPSILHGGPKMLIPLPGQHSSLHPTEGEGFIWGGIGVNPPPKAPSRFVQSGVGGAKPVAPRRARAVLLRRLPSAAIKQRQ